jgi:hypothetical protein
MHQKDFLLFAFAALACYKCFYGTEVPLGTARVFDDFGQEITSFDDYQDVDEIVVVVSGGQVWIPMANHRQQAPVYHLRNAQDFWKVNYLEKLLRDAEDLGIIESAKDERVPFARSVLDAAPAFPQWYLSLLSCRNPVAMFLAGRPLLV